MIKTRGLELKFGICRNLHAVIFEDNNLGWREERVEGERGGVWCESNKAKREIKR